MPRKHIVRPGDGWARLAGQYYGGNQRWLIELAKANGGINRVLQPGDVIDLPDFDQTQTPVITPEQWYGSPATDTKPETYGVPTGMTGNQVNYGYHAAGATASAIDSSGPVIPSSFGGKYGPVPPPIPKTWADQWDAAANKSRPAATVSSIYGPGGPGYSPTPTATSQGRGGGAGYFNANTGQGANGVTAAGRQQIPPKHGSLPNGGSAANRKPPRPPSVNILDPNNISAGANQLGAWWNSTRSQLPRWNNPPRPSSNQIYDIGNIAAGWNDFVGPAPITTSRQNTPSESAARWNGSANPAYNAAKPGPTPTPASDKSWIAEAARWVGLDFYEFGKTGDASKLVRSVSWRVAQELPVPEGFSSIEEFMQALGYRIDPNGNWLLYRPGVASSYRPQTYMPSATYNNGGGGGGYGGGGLTRGPGAVQYGYPPNNTGPGLVMWRIQG